ncbi:hypothetical protein Pcac1_g861 [Phytophthora cactorum]|nr:hypothetical protein Pcac1_g861 [Phytophthora cactorum]KAG2826439.1 hypothetical protein PC112_g9289 [Phytophthora cactorum]KAG2937410.1 hypothetical protein PC115_g4225 [Phytophthora cactorum]KAG3086957.1 hypothetical protein PC122_g9048 [Phytophthora cactorum]
MIHLENEQMVTFRSSDEPAVVVTRGKHTMLTRFFELCACEVPDNEVAKSTLYQDIPKLFRWDTKAKRWVRRNRYQAVLGRMIHVPPRDMQRFYMRVLLCHRKGPTSFENLRTVDGVTYDSYCKAALHAGYLEDDSEWVACMTEASQFRMPYQLRQLFATIIVYSQVVEVGALWERFYDDLSLDFGYKYRSLEGHAKEEMVKFHTFNSLNDGEDEELRPGAVPRGLTRMVDAMYADIHNPEIANDEYFANRTILTTTNAVVQRINEAVAQRLEGVSQEYLSANSVEEDEQVNFFEQEVLHTVNINGIPPQRTCGGRNGGISCKIHENE